MKVVSIEGHYEMAFLHFLHTETFLLNRKRCVAFEKYIAVAIEVIIALSSESR